MNDDLLINVGCGLVVPNGWVNIDRSPSLVLTKIPGASRVLRRLGVLSSAHVALWPKEVVRHDVRRGLPFTDGTVRGIYSSHMLTLLYLDEVEGLLWECHRVLRPGGTLRIAVADFPAWAQDCVVGQRGPFPSAGAYLNHRIYGDRLNAPSRVERLRYAFSPGGHKWLPTLGLLEGLLTRAGFTDVAQKGFLIGCLPDLAAVEIREESLFVEATR